MEEALGRILVRLGEPPSIGAAPPEPPLSPSQLTVEHA
jgi:hypothetical protein